MTPVQRLRQRIASLERLQARRRVEVEQRKRALDASIERAEREIVNLKSQLAQHERISLRGLRSIR